MKHHYSVKSQIIRLLSVIAAGILGAVAITGFLLYRYSPTGTYLAGNAILSPEVIRHLSYIDDPAKQGKTALRYVFNDITFLYKNLNTGEWRKIPLSLEQYQKIYTLLSADQSLDEIKDHVPGEFARNQPAGLALTVKQENNPQAQIKLLEEMQFSLEGNYYRIKLTGGTDGPQEWAYFEHSRVYSKILEELQIP